MTHQSKEAYYFSHDYSASGDPKMRSMVATYGATGYGIFWFIVEMLHSDSTHKLPLEDYVYEAIARPMLVEPEWVKKFLDDCRTKHKLFCFDASFFWSDRVCRNFNEREAKRSKKVEAGKMGGISSGKSRKSKQNEALLLDREATLEANEANEAKERKGKENKDIVDAENGYGVIYNIDEYLQTHAKDWQQLCMAHPNKGNGEIRDIVKKYHLWSLENDKYPKKPMQLIAGIKKWILNEKSLNGNGQHEQFYPAPTYKELK